VLAHGSAGIESAPACSSAHLRQVESRSAADPVHGGKGWIQPTGSRRGRAHQRSESDSEGGMGDAKDRNRFSHRGGRPMPQGLVRLVVRRRCDQNARVWFATGKVKLETHRSRRCHWSSTDLGGETGRAAGVGVILGPKGLARGTIADWTWAISPRRHAWNGVRESGLHDNVKSGSQPRRVCRRALRVGTQTRGASAGREKLRPPCTAHKLSTCCG
jgi:hypothetical protein